MKKHRVQRLINASFITCLVIMAIALFVGITFMAIGWNMKVQADKGQIEFQNLWKTYIILGSVFFVWGLFNCVEMIISLTIKKMFPFVTELSEVKSLAIILIVIGCITCFYPIYVGVKIVKMEPDDFPPLGKINEVEDK